MPEPTPIKKTFVRAAEPTPKPEAAPKPILRPHSVSREIGSVGYVMLGMLIATVIIFTAEGLMWPLMSRMMIDSAAIGAASLK